MVGSGKTAWGPSPRRQGKDAVAAKAPGKPHESGSGSGGLLEITGFGSNPGNLRMLVASPRRAAASPALVVVLHGCTQTAAGYNAGTGWSALAEKHGFFVLFAEQRAANNPRTCFSWFERADTERDWGEALSIWQMIEKTVADHAIDRSRIFITGLSAGGAMTSVMLATYPEVFAGGAIIAGLPYRAATNFHEAFRCMFQGIQREPRAWGDLVRAASSHQGPWPKLSVWQGTKDRTVTPGNAGEIIKQWSDVHGLHGVVPRLETVNNYLRKVWHGPSGEALLEEYVLTGIGHGTPVDSSHPESTEAAGPFLLEAGISSTYHIARFWGLLNRPSVTPDVLDRIDHRVRKDKRRHVLSALQGLIVKALKAVGRIKS
jgi:feruloyl esterase